MQKIAIISDIHGNLPALEAVLSDIKNSYKAGEIYCLGDLVNYAPWHNEVIDIFRREQIVCILGNHDKRIAFGEEVQAIPSHLSDVNKARLQAIKQC